MWVFLRTAVWYAHHWDVALSYALTLRDNQRSRRLARLFAHLGDSILWFAGALGSLIWATRRGRDPGPAQGLLLLLLATSLTTLTFKSIVHRQRPGPVEPLLVGPGPDKHSFPSGHAARMAAIAVWMASRHGWLGTLGVLLAAIVGWSRMRLGIHFAGDILAGYALGGIVALMLTRLGRRRVTPGSPMKRPPTPLRARMPVQ